MQLHTILRHIPISSLFVDLKVGGSDGIGGVILSTAFSLSLLLSLFLSLFIFVVSFSFLLSTFCFSLELLAKKIN